MSARTQKEKLVVGAGAFGVLLVAALSWLMIVSPELSNAANLRQQTDDAQTMNLMLMHQVNDLRSASAKLPAVRAEMNAVRDALPTVAGIDTLTRQLAATARASNVQLSSVVADSPAPVTLTATSASATGPQNAAGKLYSIKVTVITSGRTVNQQAFLRRLQQGSRAVLVMSSALGSASGSAVRTLDATTTMTLELKVFAAPQSPQAEAELNKQLGN